VKNDKVGLYLFRLLRLRSILYRKDDANLEVNNRLIFTTLSKLAYAKLHDSAEDVAPVLETAFASKKFEVFFVRNISSVNCDSFHPISGIFSLISAESTSKRVASRDKNPWMLATQCSVFTSLINFLISTYSDAGPSAEGNLQCDAQISDNHGSQAIFSRVRVENWDGSHVVISFDNDVALSHLVASACQRFNHQPGSFDVVCAHSRIAYTPAEIGISLSQVGLVPTGKVYLQERKSASLAEIEVIDLIGGSMVVHFEVTATLNDIACYVRDHRHRKFYPKKSFSIVVNGNKVFQESSFSQVSLLKAGLLPSGSISFQDSKHCLVSSGHETCIKDFLCFAKAIITPDSPLFNSDTARLIVSLLQCPLCYDAQSQVLRLLMVLLPTCHEDIIASIRRILLERIDLLSKVNIRCQCDAMELWYNEFFHGVKDGYGNTLLRSLLKLRAVPNAIHDNEFFETVDRIVLSRTHLHRHTLWVHRDSLHSTSLTNALAELFLENEQDLIGSLGQTSPQSPFFLRLLSKLMTLILSKCQNEDKVGLKPDLIRIYVSAMQNARKASSPCCTDAALIVAYIFSMHLKKERGKTLRGSVFIEAHKWNLLLEHFHVAGDICMMSGAVLPPMLRVFTSFLEASCMWFGPENLMQKRDLNAEFGESRLNSLVSAALEVSSHSNYLFLDSAACFFKVMASHDQLSQRLTAAVPDAILLMLENYQTFCVKYMAQCTAHDDKSHWQHVFEAFDAIVPLSHLEAAVLKPATLEVLCRFYSNFAVMDTLSKMQSIPNGREMVGSSLHTITAVLNAINNGNGKTQSKAIKVLAAGLQSPASLVWRHAPGLKEALNHLVYLASEFFFVDGQKRIEEKQSYDESHILFSVYKDLVLLLESLICCSSKVLTVSGNHVDLASEAVFDVRDLLVFTFDLLKNCETFTSDLDTCDAEYVSSCAVMSCILRVLQATPPSLVIQHILNYFDNNSCAVPVWLLCALNALANNPACLQLLCSDEMMACFLKVGLNPVVSSCLQLALTQEANENFLHLEYSRPEYDWDINMRNTKRPRYCYKDYLSDCKKFDALKQQRLNGLAHSRSLYQLIARLAVNTRQEIFLKKELLCMLLDAVRPDTNLLAVDDILSAIGRIFGRRSRVDTHSIFDMATFHKMRRFLFFVLGQIQTVSVRISQSNYGSKVKRHIWSDICKVLGNYVDLLLQIYPFRTFRRALTVTDERLNSSHLGGKSIIAAVIHILGSATMLTRYALVSANPFDLFSRMLLSPVKRNAVAILFPDIVKIVLDDQKLHQQKFFKKNKKRARFTFGFVDFDRYKSDVLSSMISFMSSFTHSFPSIALQQASQISSFGVFACRMASYVEPRIIQQTCEYISQLLRTPLSGAVYESFASASFADLAALCDYALLPSQPEPSELPEVKVIEYHDKLAIVQLIEKVASFQPLSGDCMTLALLRLIWGCSSSEEIRDIAQPARALLTGMGVTRDNFFHVLPKHSKPIAASTLCYMEDFCFADEGEEFFQLVCGHVGHSYCMLEPVFTSGKCPKCRHICVFRLCRRDSSPSDSGIDSY
jgi:hypothetical protein